MSMRWGLLIFIVLSVLPALAQRERANLWCEQGGQTVTVNGVVSSTKVQKSYPSCTVTVYDTGTSNLTSLCTDAACTTPLINPFTSTSTGYITFFAQTEPAIVDVQQSGGGLATPITTRGLELCDVTTCLGGGGGGGSGSVAGTPPHIAKFTDATTVGNSVGQDDGTTPTTWPLGVSLVTNALFTVKVNNGTTGTTVNLLVARDSSGNAITAQPTDTNNLIGIAGAGAGLTGSVSIAYSGEFSCTMDNQSAIADWVILGSGGQCHDAGAVEPAGVQNIGRIASVNAGAGTLATVDLGLPDVTSPASGGGGGNGTVGPCASFPGPIAYYSALNTITCDAFATLDGAGNYTGASATYSGTVGGFVAFGQGTAPTFCPTGSPCVTTNSVALHGPASVATAFDTALPATPGIAGQALVIDTAPDATHITTKWDTVTGSTPIKTCMMIFGADNGTALADADIAPQSAQCFVSASATALEINVKADGGTPSLVVSKISPTGTVTALLSTALATAGSGAFACSNTGGTTGLNGTTTCSATLQNTSLPAGYYIQTTTATAGGTAKRLSVAVAFQ